MKVNIERAIKSITDEIDFYQPLYEGIVNAFQAEADEVKINFVLENGYVVGYSVQDNGEGFTDENIDAFLTLWSDHKIKKGALGSGRILCLKVFEDILIESQTKDTITQKGQKVNIKFNRDFKANNINDEEIQREENSSSTSYTITRYQNIHDDYQKTYQNNRVPFDQEKVQDAIFINLLPLFIGKKTSGQPFSIYFGTTQWINQDSLKEKFDDLQFEEKQFKMNAKYQDEECSEEEFVFTLTYQIKNDQEGNLDQFYGAADRKVKDFTGSVRLKPLPNDYSGIFCLSSPYFDTRVKDSRKDFTMEANQSIPSDQNPITFPQINDQLENLLKEILFKKFPTIEEDLTARKEKIASQFPHLARYIKPIDKLGITESEIIKEAEKTFLDNSKKTVQQVEKFTENIKKGKKFNEEKFLELTTHFTETGREQLASYIGYRQTIIDMLHELLEQHKIKKGSINEKMIHDLFMPMSTTSDISHPYANNIWIFDDKFMSFNYAASDKTIAKIVADVEGKASASIPDHHKDKTPDLVMFYSDEESAYKDVVLVEFKKFGEPIDAKEKAINQLERYPLYIRKNIENVRSIFTYTILDIDDELREVLKDVKRFQENAFGDKENNFSAYYTFNEGQKAHINVVSFEQVLHDAAKRNKVFLNILLEKLKSE